MSVPPALTWTHLFPSDVSYTCLGAPLWFRELVEATGATGRQSVLIAWEQSPKTLPDLDAYYGIVAVNCRGLSSRALQNAGFTYVRQFGVLPGIAEARLFIPLTTSSIAASAFRLYTPFRLSARLKNLGARAAARLSIPFWYRDHMYIAQRTQPPLRSLVLTLFEGSPVYLALSSGAPEPARNRKASVAIFDAGGRPLAFAKLSGSLLAEQLLRHEAGVLRALAVNPGVAQVAPHLLFEGEIERTYITVVSALPGHSPGLELTASHQRFLATLHGDVRKPATATALVRSLPHRAAALPSPRPDLLAVLHDAIPALEGLSLPETIVHGDFTPWNLREQEGRISAFDWEYAELDGLPLWDELHHTLLVGHLLKRWTVEQAVQRLLELASSAPFGLPPQQVLALESLYLVDFLLRMFSEGYDETNDDLVAWYGRLLGQLSGIARGAVVA